MHVQCALKWLVCYHPTCPICRTKTNLNALKHDDPLRVAYRSQYGNLVDWNRAFYSAVFWAKVSFLSIQFIGTTALFVMGIVYTNLACITGNFLLPAWLLLAFVCYVKLSFMLFQVIFIYKYSEWVKAYYSRRTMYLYYIQLVLLLCIFALALAMSGVYNICNATNATLSLTIQLLAFFPLVFDILESVFIFVVTLMWCHVMKYTYCQHIFASFSYSSHLLTLRPIAVDPGERASARASGRELASLRIVRPNLPMGSGGREGLEEVGQRLQQWRNMVAAANGGDSGSMDEWGEEGESGGCGGEEISSEYELEMMTRVGSMVMAERREMAIRTGERGGATEHASHAGLGAEQNV